jgi:hypothetical protein
MIEVVFEKDRYHTIKTMEKWCRENIGVGGWVYADPKDWEEERKWAMSSAFGRTTFYFRDGEDATMFTLRWT